MSIGPYPFNFRTLAAGAIMLASCCTALAQTAPPAAPSTAQSAPVMPKEITLTDKQIQGALEAQKDFDAIAEKMPNTEAAQRDPKIISQLEATAKTHGFADYADYNNVLETVSLVLAGFDPKTKTYVGPEAVLKQQIAAVQADKQMPAKEKQAALAEMNAVLKSPPPPIRNRSNIDIVAKYYDQLAAAMQEE